MRKLITKFLAAALLMLVHIASFAQDKSEMADVMRSNGKIYVVVAVCVTILLGLFIYVWSVDRKLKKLEKESGSK